MDAHPHWTTFIRAVLYIILAGAILGTGALALSHERLYAIATYRAATDAEEPRHTISESEPTLELIAVGDIMLARAIGHIMAEHNDWTYPFRELREMTTAADLAVGNLEGPISERGVQQGSIYSFRADPRTITGLTDAGFDVLTVANNHMWDYGPDAFRDTLAHLSLAGMHATGGGDDALSAHTPVIRTANGIRVAFLGYTNLIPKARDTSNASPAIAYLDPEVATADIIRAGQEADIVVVLVHWGEEYQTRASGMQRDTARALIDAGATLVIGHHPHVVQEIEPYGTGLIAYSLGNFVFDQNFSPDTRRGLALRVTLDKDGIVSHEPLPLIFSKSFQPMIASSTL